MSGEFASVMMVRVMRQGLRGLGLPPLPEADAGAAGPGATVDLDLKRALATHAVAHGGLACLPRLGQGVHHYPDEPTHRAMTRAATPQDLFTRWRRLERYIHSSHRIEVRASASDHLEIAHVGVRNEVLPTLPESLLVCGVLAALLESLGASGVQVETEGCVIYPAPAESSLHALAFTDADRRWRFQWKAFSAPRRPARARGAIRPPEVDTALPDWAQGLMRQLMDDPVQSPTLGEAAQRLGQSTRSLQRALHGAGTRYSELVASVRVRWAACHLTESDAALAEIGFLCGYADQAHFTREFRRRVGLTPERYRRAFGAPG